MSEETEYTPESTEAWALRRTRERMHVSRFQGLAALSQMGLLAAIEAYIENSGDPIVQLAWREASFKRLSPMVETIGGQIGLSDLQLDDIFALAATIEA